MIKRLFIHIAPDFRVLKYGLDLGGKAEYAVVLKKEKRRNAAQSARS